MATINTSRYGVGLSVFPFLVWLVMTLLTNECLNLDFIS